MRTKPIWPRHTRPHVVKFLEKVEIVPGGCWLWKGYIEKNGYGYYRHPDSNKAHRVSYMLFAGPIADNMTIDHLCRNPPCVNPDHLEVVTQAENSRRANDGGWTKCETYHPGQPARWQQRGDGRTFCRECNRVRERQRRARAATATP